MCPSWNVLEIVYAIYLPMHTGTNQDPLTSRLCNDPNMEEE